MVGIKMKNSTILLYVCFVLSLTGILYLFSDSHTVSKRQNGSLSHEIYVWQRHWGPLLSQAIDRASNQSSGFSVLAAEISWKAGQVDQIVRVPIDYARLKATGKPVGLALRIGPYSGTFDNRSSATTLVTDLGASLIADARSAGIEPAELQIDFDCAESKLSGYEIWIRAVREKIHPVDLTITVLPSWLKKRAFPGLVRAAGSFVLQVHSLERPKSSESPITLCDSAATLRWVEQASRIGIPFRVALPTYGYLMAFNSEGSFIGLSAEGPSKAWPGDTILRRIQSDPISMAKLVRNWQRDRSAHMRGVIWYRLPVESDRLNWKWATLSAIMSGRVPHEALNVEVEYPQPELAEIIIANSGEIDLSAKINIEVEYEVYKLIAADGLNGFAIDETKPSKICFKYSENSNDPIIRAGERWKVAWLRFKEKTEVKTHVIMPQT